MDERALEIEDAGTKLRTPLNKQAIRVPYADMRPCTTPASRRVGAARKLCYHDVAAAGDAAADNNTPRSAAVQPQTRKRGRDQLERTGSKRAATRLQHVAAGQPSNYGAKWLKLRDEHAEEVVKREAAARAARGRPTIDATIKPMATAEQTVQAI